MKRTSKGSETDAGSGAQAREEQLREPEVFIWGQGDWGDIITSSSLEGAWSEAGPVSSPR